MTWKQAKDKARLLEIYLSAAYGFPFWKPF